MLISFGSVPLFGYYYRGRILDTTGLVSPEALPYLPTLASPVRSLSLRVAIRFVSGLDIAREPAAENNNTISKPPVVAIVAVMLFNIHEFFAERQAGSTRGR